MKTLIIDNYDSYTYNLYQMIAKINSEEPFVVHNDAIDWEMLKQHHFDNIVISPGPGNPNKKSDFGICRDSLLEANVPILGICLGHQGLGNFYGARVIQAPEIMHGRLSKVFHNNSDLFKGIPQGFKVVRYHSLILQNQTFDQLEVIAATEDDVIMGIRHVSLPLWGVQFHPESICTEYGEKLLENFRDITLDYHKGNGESEKRMPLELLYGYSALPKKSFERIDLQDSPYRVLVRKIDTFFQPEEVYTQFFSEKPFSFWLDSSRTDSNMARFSFVGAAEGPLSQIIKYDLLSGKVEVSKQGNEECYNESLYDYMDRELAKMYCTTDVPFDFNTGFVGYFGYEMKVDTGGDHVHTSKLPDGMFIFADRLIVFDYLEMSIYLICLTENNLEECSEKWFDEMQSRLEQMSPLETIKHCKVESCRKLSIELNRNHDEYIHDVYEIQKYLTKGETYEINLTNELRVKVGVDPLLLYRNLRMINPAPYSAYLNFKDFQVLCTSPERFLKIDRNGFVEAKPIKGTIARGDTPEEDEKLRNSLANSEKERAENLMIVDLLRNDLGLICEVGSVSVPKLMDVESYQTVHQLVSTVRGKIKEGLSAISCIREAFPGGSMTGAPKIRSMQIIDRLELRPRAIYSGVIGFIGINGASDLNIVIRTIVSCNQELSIGVGGAVTILSDAENEYEEMLQKAKALIKAIVITAFGSFSDDKFEIVGDRKMDSVSV